MALQAKTRKSARVKISQSGQITLPVHMRKVLGVERGDYVNVVEYTDGSVAIEPEKILTMKELVGMAQPWPEGLSREEVYAEARRYGAVRKRYRDGDISDDRD